MRYLGGKSKGVKFGAIFFRGLCSKCVETVVESFLVFVHCRKQLTKRLPYDPV